MLTIKVAKLNPANVRLNGATLGEAHAREVRHNVVEVGLGEDQLAILDFQSVEGATASYLKRFLNPFFAPAEASDGFGAEVFPIAINVQNSDLKEDLGDYLIGKSRVLILAKFVKDKLKLEALLGILDGAASETFKELTRLKRSTAFQLYERHREETTNQTAWNNRLTQLVDMRLARRTREGRFWIYEPTVLST